MNVLIYQVGKETVNPHKSTYIFYKSKSSFELFVDQKPDEAVQVQKEVEFDAEHWLLKEEILPDGSKKLLLKVKGTGELVQREM